MTLLASASPAAGLDWPSLTWVAVIAALTFTCLTVRARYREIAAHGRACEFLAHVVVGYFGLGMTAFGAHAAATSRFPVPGGVAWEGGIALAGGLAAVMVGACTLIEHAASVIAVRRSQPATSPVTVVVSR